MNVKISITCHAAQVSLNETTQVRLKSLFDGAEFAFRSAPILVARQMGLEPPASEIKIKLFDSRGYEEEMKRRNCQSSDQQTHVGGSFHADDMSILLNAGSLNVKYRNLSHADPASHFESEAALHTFFGLLLAYTAYHELFHLYHEVLFPGFLSAVSHWLRDLNEEGLLHRTSNGPAKFNPLLFHFGARMAVIEGLACFATERIFFDVFQLPIISQMSFVSNFSEREPTIDEKLMALNMDSNAHSLGHWFVREVANRTGQNPIPLILHSPPNFLELLYPENYSVR